MEGTENLLAKLNDLSVIDKDLYRIMDDCGKFVADDARLRTAVDTGDLRKSIQHTTSRQDDGVISMIHTNSDHAHFVEFGTGPVGAAHHEGISPNITPLYSREKWMGVIPSLKSQTDSGIRYIAGQRAQPYLYPALKENEEQLIRYINQELREAIRRKLND